MAQLDTAIPGKRLAAITAIVSLPFAYLTQLLFMSASGGDVGIFHNGQAMMSLADDQAAMFYTAMWTDILGYYLIFLPLIVYAWKALRPVDESLADIAFLCGLIYCLLGSFAAVSMAGAFDALHSGNAVGSEAAWEAAVAAGWRGYWLLEAILASIWLGGLARLLWVVRLDTLGWGAAILAAIWFVQFASWHVGQAALSDAALAAVVMLSPLWSAWLGISLLRQTPQAQPATGGEQLA